MKRLFYLTVAALAFAACAKEVTPEPIVTPEDNTSEKVTISLTASFADESDSKAEINFTNGVGSWEEGDQIAVHTANGALATLTAESSGTSVTFSGTIDSGDSVPEGAIAYYPASVAVEGHDDVVNWPTSYTSAAAARKGFVLRGVVAYDDNVEFKHIGAILKISINNVPSSVTAIEFTAPNRQITGSLSVNSTPECAMGTIEGSTKVTITSSAAERSSSTSEFYLPLPTGTLSGFSIGLKKSSETISTKSTSNGVALSRASLKKMKAFTPEGEGSTWYVVGGFNGWNYATSTQMTEVLGLENWVVARNVNIEPQSEEDPGFKFLPQNTSWENAWGCGSISSLQTEYQANQNEKNNITYGDNTGTYDIFFNTSSHKFYLTNADAAAQYRTVYLMTDMELPDGTYYLHVWPHSGTGTSTIWPGIAGSVEVVEGITYYKFEMGAALVAGAYDCCFNNGNTPSVRYDFRSGQLVVPDDDSSSYYLSFTSTVWAGNKGEGNDNPMTQFTDPAQPQGASTWKVLDNSIGSSGTYFDMKWGNGPVLVSKAVLVRASSQLVFRFTNGSVNNFYYASGEVAQNSDFAVTFEKEGSRSEIAKFSVEGLTQDTFCDIYLDIINKKAKIVPREATTTLYFSLDREVSKAYLYTWGGLKTTPFPGIQMTDTEIINGKTYYKAYVPSVTADDDQVNMIVSDGNYSGHWQTSNFTTADLSGSKSEYFFKVSGSTITQLSGRPEAISISIDGSFSDWGNEDITGNTYVYEGKGTTTTMKAYATSTVLFVYLNLKNNNGANMSYSNDGSYFRLHFDTDDKLSTGYDTENWIYAGSDYLDNSKTLQTILAFYYKSDSVSNACFRGYESTDVTQKSLEDAGALIKAADGGANGVQVELKIPLSLIETISSSSTIKVFCVGSGDYVVKLPGVRIP